MMTEGLCLIAVVVPSPAHGRLPEVLTYVHPCALPTGGLVRVPLGRRELLGVVWGSEQAPPPEAASDKLKPIGAVLSVAPLDAAWCALIRFAATYYQRHLGELAMAALPPQLRDLTSVQMERLLRKLDKRRSKAALSAAAGAAESAAEAPLPVPDLSADQQAALSRLASAAAHSDTRPVLLFGVTGSGKTEVYLRRVEQVLADAAGQSGSSQVLVMVPEINLTPQLESRFRHRIEAQYGPGSVVLMHSGLTPAQRLQSWLAAHTGQARLVLGTRLAILASMPYLRLIVVDEEHDPSYKSQDGARYSARDLAVYRGTQARIQVILGSATPALETWHNALPTESGLPRYQRVDMPTRMLAAQMPHVQLLDMRLQPKAVVLAPSLLAAITERAQRGEQSLVFLNRRGYAPVLHCAACAWKSDCPNCSAWQVFHKKERQLRCHHCAVTLPVPRQCPVCGNLDIGMQGRGTEQLEELLVAQLGAHLRVLRMDADSTKHKGSLEAQMAQVHAGAVDVVVGTQMVTKGHDFRRITLVAAINPDSALFAADFRAPERLFSLLMQAAGRAGRNAQISTPSVVYLQTQHPTHPLYLALQKHDYPRFAAQQLQDRQNAGMPPFTYQALLRAEAHTQESAQAFLNDAAAIVLQGAQFAPWQDLQSGQGVVLYPAIPMSMQRVANVERAQMLVESSSRVALQKMLTAWQPHLRALKTHGVLRWALDVDPLTI